jgi:hypothetical protein
VSHAAIRAHMYFSCAYFQPMTDADGNVYTRSLTVFLFDPKGMIPKFVINLSGSKFSEVVDQFRDVCEGSEEIEADEGDE